MLTESLRSSSWRSHRLLAAGPKPKTQLHDTPLVGWILSGWTLPALAFAAMVAGVAGTIGPDARWLSALGRSIVRLDAIPHGVPYAAASSGGWHNVPVLAELIFRGLQSSFGDRGFLAAQVVATVLALILIARDARRLGATDAGIASALVVVLVAGLLAFAGIHAQLFSLVLFPAVLLLLRSDERSPSRRIWLLVPLLALWSNLHGAVLVGFGIALLYLVGRARRRPLESAAVAAASALALCATPALAGSPAYYVGVMTSEAASRGYGLWAPLSLHSGFDLLLVGGALILLAGFVRARPQLWQLIAAAILAVLTVHAARNGIWLLLFLAAPAASSVRMAPRLRPAVSHCVALALAAGAVAGFVRGPLEPSASPRLIAKAIGIAHGQAILAEPIASEQIAGAGGRVWVSNPLDAFSHADQRLYLDWLEGKPAGDAAAAHASVIIVRSDSRAAQRLASTRQARFLAGDGDALLFTEK